MVEGIEIKLCEFINFVYQLMMGVFIFIFYLVLVYISIYNNNIEGLYWLGINKQVKCLLVLIKILR